MKNLELRIEKKELRVVMGLAIPSGRRTCQFLILNSKFLICCVSLLFCSNAMADSLKFKFSPGDKYSLVSVNEQKMARVADGNEQTAEQTTRLECDFDVEEVDESGCAWVKYTFKRITMTLRSQGQKADFDSDANQLKTPMQAVPLRLAMGEELYLRVTPQGRIERINGLQALITSAKAKVGSFAGADKVGQAVAQMFAEPTVRRELEDQLRVFPEPNEPGTTWSRTEILSSAEMGGAQAEQVEEVNVVFEKTFRLNPGKSVGLAIPSGSQVGIAVVDVNLVIRPASAPVSSEPTSESSVRANREILGDGAGQIEIEEATGRIISSKMVQDMAERVIYVAQGAMLRSPPASKPITTHMVTTFQMTRRQPPAPSDVEEPGPGKVEGDKPASPADANEKGAPATRPS
jgi:hypothetical protein